MDACERPRLRLRRRGPTPVQTVAGPTPVETPGRPLPTWTRAILGPTPIRTPRDEALNRTPGMIRIPNPIPANLRHPPDQIQQRTTHAATCATRTPYDHPPGPAPNARVGVCWPPARNTQGGTTVKRMIIVLAILVAAAIPAAASAQTPTPHFVGHGGCTISTCRYF